MGQCSGASPSQLIAAWYVSSWSVLGQKTSGTPGVAFIVVVAVVGSYGVGWVGGEQKTYVDLPSNHGQSLDDALRRLHAVGLRATFGAASQRCGNAALPWVNVQSPSAPARVVRNTVVNLNLDLPPSPLATAPLNRPRWTYVPDLVGEEASTAFGQLDALWPCVHVRAATATSASRLVVVKQSPAAGTRVRAYGVKVGGGWSPTIVNVEVEAR